MTIVSIFGILNIYTLIGMFQIALQIKTPKVGNLFIIISAGCLIYLYYHFLMKNGKAKEIVKEFKEMKQNKGILNSLLTIYIIGSIVLFIYTGNIIRHINQ